jgi:hypothetical protein
MELKPPEGMALCTLEEAILFQEHGQGTIMYYCTSWKDPSWSPCSGYSQIKLWEEHYSYDKNADYYADLVFCVEVE